MGTDIIASTEEPETKRGEITCSRPVESCRDEIKDDSTGSRTQTQIITFKVFADRVSNARSS